VTHSNHERISDAARPDRLFDEDFKAVLLVGGMGTRLRSVLQSVPKPLASMGNRSFLELLVRQLRSHGLRRLVMCTGYLPEQIQTVFGDGRNWDVMIEYSKEPSPLGTAGALKLAQASLETSRDFLVMNGDSFLEADLHELFQFHRRRGGLITMAVCRTEDASRFGTVRVDRDSRVTGFGEKTGEHVPGLVNAGIYIFNRQVLDHIPEGPCSLERQVFPQMLGKGVYALEQKGMFIDIGTPEDYARARAIYDRLYASVVTS
jgi:D-glycero-alpha-D-manno-heptose 1-phosphate guanylyltransferase